MLKHYSKEMYYRLLAFKFLPPEMDKILYLDPDLIVINPLRGLYDTDIDDYLFAAAFHDRVSVKEVNKLRLMPYEIAAYYNTGVMLMNLARQAGTDQGEGHFRFRGEEQGPAYSA